MTVPMWKVGAERAIYDSPWVRLSLVEVEPPGGEPFDHHLVRLNPVASAVVLDDSGERLLFLRRHRFATGQVGYEAPGGIVKDGEDPAETARRETEEETGFRPTGEGKLMAKFFPNPGISDGTLHVYFFRGATQVGQPSDPDEAGSIEWVPKADIPKLIKNGELLGADTLVGALGIPALTA